MSDTWTKLHITDPEGAALYAEWNAASEKTKKAAKAEKPLKQAFAAWLSTKRPAPTGKVLKVANQFGLAYKFVAAGSGSTATAEEL